MAWLPLIWALMSYWRICAMPETKEIVINTTPILSLIAATGTFPAAVVKPYKALCPTCGAIAWVITEF